ncbi:hypothetical protein JET14_17260 [Martelella lutilitoris]|uniref:Integrase catalytic domain-containing protein n=1 Tax=Martelella lutilitoris TaxID=2583532 RepID=A0A7T7HIV6_9HYPH|nr:hypothetical protein [Martelella lutilitoris]QQM30016.1 hypothetical protein JET14_17260 [Martelella lutilitoris]
MSDPQNGTVFRFESGTLGRFGHRKIKFLRAANTGYLVEFLPDPEARNVPETLRGTRPDIEFVGRKFLPHSELYGGLLDGTLEIDEDDHVFIDHSQRFKPELVASLAERPAQDLILRYASVTLMREICDEKGIITKTRREIRKIEAEILTRLPHRIDELNAKVDGRRRHPFRRRKTPQYSTTAQTLLEWDKKLRGQGFSGLADNRYLSGNRLCKLHPVVARIVRQKIDELVTLEQIPIAAVHSGISDAVKQERQDQEDALSRREAEGEDISEAEWEALQKLRPPSVGTVSKWVASLAPLEAMLRGRGPDWLLSNCLSVGLGMQVERAGQITMIDEYTADVFAIIPFAFLIYWLGEQKVAELGIDGSKPLRVVVSIMIDAYTGCILGLQIRATADPDLAKRTIMMSLMDKTKIAAACGAEGAWDHLLRPEKILHDAGSAYVACSTDMLCASLRIENMTAPKAKAFIRGLMERVFRTLHETLLAKIPGKAFSDTVKRGDYDAEAEAILTLDDLIQVITIWVVDIYHNSSNFGRDGLTPNDLWRHEMAFGKGCRPVPDLKTMTHVFGTTLKRKARQTGIRVMHADYSSKDFMKEYLRKPNRDFRIRWWEEDISQIQVEIRPNEWMPLEVMDRRARGISVYEWDLLRRHEYLKRNPADDEVRQRAQSRIDAMLEEKIATSRKVARKALTAEEVARWEEETLRYYVTPSTEISSDQSHGLYGARVRPATQERAVVPEDDQPQRKPTRKQPGRRTKPNWQSGTTE